MNDGRKLSRTGTLIDRSSELHVWDSVGNTTEPPIAAWVDHTNRLTVQVFRTPAADGTPWEGSLRVGLRWFKDGDQRAATDMQRNWTWFQSIKDELWPERIAIEIYPPAEKIVDAAPMRWLWVLPPGASIPFNLADSHDYLRS